MTWLLKKNAASFSSGYNKFFILYSCLNIFQLLFSFYNDQFLLKPFKSKLYFIKMLLQIINDETLINEGRQIFKMIAFFRRVTREARIVRHEIWRQDPISDIAKFHFKLHERFPELPMCSRKTSNRNFSLTVVGLTFAPFLIYNICISCVARNSHRSDGPGKILQSV